MHFLKKSIKQSGLLLVSVLFTSAVWADGLPSPDEVTLTVINKPNKTKKSGSEVTIAKDSGVKVSLNNPAVNIPAPLPPPTAPPLLPRRQGVPEH